MECFSVYEEISVVKNHFCPENKVSHRETSSTTRFHTVENVIFEHAQNEKQNSTCHIRVEETVTKRGLIQEK